jgi:2-polyprenyl-6-methoxyphenol hydroxylase-like FAD-dependent oxidoreductase
MVRRRLGIAFPDVAPAQSFAVFEFKTDFDHGDKARIVYSDEGTSVMWPLPRGYCRWGFEVEPATVDQFSREKDRFFVQVGNQGYRALESTMLHELLQSRAPWFDGSVEQFRWRMLVRFEKRLATAFGRDRVWLAGDAGHMTGPVGMQSMNIGMKEGRELANCIADCLDGKNTQAMQSYNEGRLDEWHCLLGMNRAFSSRDDTDPFIASHSDRIFRSLPASIDSLPKFAAKLGLDLSRL